MHPADFLNKWLEVIPAGRQAEFYAELTGLVTPPEKHISVETYGSDTRDTPVIVVRIGSYAFDITPEEAIRIGYTFQKAATEA